MFYYLTALKRISNSYQRGPRCVASASCQQGSSASEPTRQLATITLVSRGEIDNCEDSRKWQYGKLIELDFGASILSRVKKLKSGADQTKNRLAKRVPIISAFGHEQLASPVRIQNGSLAAGGRQSTVFDDN